MCVVITANEITGSLNAQGRLINDRADIEVDAVLQNATMKGLNNIYQTLNIQQQDHKLSLYLFNTMDRMEHLYKVMDYNYTSRFGKS